MKIVHIARTPLAGSPLRIARAQQAAGHDARLVVLEPHVYGRRTYPMDLVWEHDREAALAVLRAADVLHFHHYFDLRANPFGVDFTQFRGLPVRQFHTHPLTLANGDAARAREIVASPVRQLVIGQFHARFYPRASIVPNLVPLHEPGFAPVTDYRRAALIFSPTARASAYESRWDTKGLPEVLPVLRCLPLDEFNLVRKVPWAECHAIRRRSTLAVDDIVTGSHHLTSLDSAALGLVTFNYVDALTQRALAHITGADSLPFVNVALPDFAHEARRFIASVELREQYGRHAAEWMRRHYDPTRLVTWYLRAYEHAEPNPLAKTPQHVWTGVEEMPRLPDRLAHRVRTAACTLAWPWCALRRRLRRSVVTRFS
jgi:nucleotide-binding universal stress UspA family protein